MILQPAFFAPLIQYVGLASTSEVLLENQDNFQKQTYRNRCYIYGPNGKQLLTVPTVHTKMEGKQKTKDVRIDNSFNWQKNMGKSLEAAYRSSPFFEFYEDDILPLFEHQHNYLLDLNLKSMELMNDFLELENTVEFTTTYISPSDLALQKPRPQHDFRDLINAKSVKSYPFQPYVQVFENKHGFLGNLSILDLLFNEGTNALSYLQDHKNLLF